MSLATPSSAFRQRRFADGDARIGVASAVEHALDRLGRLFHAVDHRAIQNASGVVRELGARVASGARRFTLEDLNAAELLGGERVVVDTDYGGVDVIEVRRTQYSGRGIVRAVHAESIEGCYARADPRNSGD
jgi:hypothetical protein